jgi:hypothetical protein
MARTLPMSARALASIGMGEQNEVRPEGARTKYRSQIATAWEATAPGLWAVTPMLPIPKGCGSA